MTVTRLLTTAAVLALAGQALGQNIGPSTSIAPYVVPNPALGANVSTTSVLTVGDTINGYRMVGIPDGMGLLAGATAGNFNLFMHHELGASVGAVRAHGSTGAFVSRWNISNDLTVNSGRDHNTSGSDIFTWNGSGYTQGTTAYGRLCSADLAASTAYQFGSLGTSARLLLGGEEVGAEGRAFAHILSGSGENTSYQLPRLGRFSWENAVASPSARQSTIVMGMDDSTPGQVYMYFGNKTDTGNDIERAGLTNGELFGVRVTGLPNEDRNAPPAPGTRFDFFNHGNVENITGAQIQADDVANNVTQFLRPEDGQWDPRPGHENDFYFVTTDRYNSDSQVGRSRLYRMRFDDLNNPLSGGAVEAVLDGTEGINMMDNMTIDALGRVVIQEDIGGQDPLGKIWVYDIATDGLVEVAAHAPGLFTPGAPGFLTRDEESSGVVDAADILGQGWFFINVQAHYGIAGELVEGGQLLTMYIDPSVVPAPGALALLGLAGVAAGRRRR